MFFLFLYFPFFFLVFFYEKVDPIFFWKYPFWWKILLHEVSSY